MNTCTTFAAEMAKATPAPATARCAARRSAMRSRSAAGITAACAFLALSAAVFAPAAAAFSLGLRGASAEGASASQHAAQHATDRGVRAVATGDLEEFGGEVAASRHLLHGWMPLRRYPRCPRCRFEICIGNWWFGHCRRGRKIFNCYRRKRLFVSPGPRVVNGTNISNEFPPPIPAPPPELANPPTPPSGPGTSPSATVFTQNLTASHPYAACITDDDCALRVEDFAAINSSEPLSFNGTLAARCLRPDFIGEASGQFADFPGICVCTYVNPAAPRGTAERVATTLSVNITDPDVGPVDPDLQLSLATGVSATAFCLQLEGDGEDEASVDERMRRDHVVHPFFVPGNGPLMPLLMRDSAAESGPAPAPLEFDDLEEPEEITRGTVAPLSFVDAPASDFEEAVPIIGVALPVPAPAPAPPPPAPLPPPDIQAAVPPPLNATPPFTNSSAPPSAATPTMVQAVPPPPLISAVPPPNLPFPPPLVSAPPPQADLELSGPPRIPPRTPGPPAPPPPPPPRRIVTDRDELEITLPVLEA